MSKVDNRIVELGFENRDFEKGIRDSSRSLADFDKALRDSGNGSTFSGLSGIVDGVTGKFSVLGTMAVGALMKIGSQAVVMGQQLINSFAIQPIKAGFDEYELKINSIKTMLASGKTKSGAAVDLEMVNTELEKLNKYADQTIYSFSDMTSNIGKFTNAGVDLETSVQAIKGIANAAALSGASSGEASRAMYNFSQALSAGYVKLIDWKSIENANMATVEFKTQLLESAVAAGTLKKQSDGMYKVISSGDVISATKGFNDSLQDQWMTTEALTKTLNDYADETTEIGKKATEAATKVRTWSQLMDTTKEALQSGWAETWENIFGNFDDATDLWSGISKTLGNIIGKSADTRNRLLRIWSLLGGRKAIIGGLSAAWKAFSSIIGTVGQAFKEVFPPITSKKLADLSFAFKAFMEKLVPTGDTLEKIKNIFKGLFSALSLGWSIISAVFKGIVGGIKAIISFLPKGEGLLGFLSKIGLFFIGLKDAAKKGEIFTKISKAISNGIIWFAEKIKTAYNIIKNSKFISDAVTVIRKIFEKFPKKFPNWNEFTNWIKGIITNIKAWFQKLPKFDELSTWIKGIVDKIKGWFQKLPKFDGFSEWLKGIKSPIKDIGKIDTGGFDTIKEKISAFFTGLKEKIAPVSDFLKEVFGKIKEFFAKKWSTEGLNGFIKIIATFFAGGIGAGIIKLLKSITGITDSAGDIGNGLTGILTGVKDTLKGYQDTLKSKQLLTIAAAIGILAISLIAISLLDPIKMAAGAGAITALFANLTASMALFSKMGNAKKMAGQMILIAAAVLILSIALKNVKDVDINSVLVLTTVVAELVAAALLLSKMKNIKSSSANLLALSSSIFVISAAAKIFATMSISELKQGIIAVSILMAELVLFALVMSNFGGSGASMIGAGIALGIMSLALLELSGIVALLGNFKIETLVQGLGGLAALMLIVVASLTALSNPNVLLGSAAMIIMAAAIALFIPPIIALGMVPLAKIGTALLGLAGIFLVIGLAGLVLTPVIPAILGLGVAIGLMGIAMLAVGVGMMLFGMGLTAISVAGVAAVAVLTAAITGIALLIPFVAEQIGLGIVAFATVITDNAPVIVGALGAIITNLLLLVSEQVPLIVETFLTLISGLLTALVEKVPEFVDSGMKILLGFLQGINDNIQSVVDVGMSIITNFLTGIADNIQSVVEQGMEIVINILSGIAEKIPDLLTAGADIIISFLEGIATESVRIGDAGMQAVIAFINGVADSIETNTPLILEACSNLFTAFLDGLKTYFKVEEGESVAGTIITGLVNGISSGLSSVVSAVLDLGKEVLQSLKDFFGIKSPSKEFAKIGKFADEGLSLGLDKYSNKVVKSSEKLGEKSINSLQLTMNKIGDIVNSEIDSSPVISPILNLNDIKSGASTLSSLLSKGQTYNLVASKINQDKMATLNIQNGSEELTKKEQNIKNEFNLYGLTVRTEADIDKIADQLYRKQEDAMRARGIKPSYA